MGEAPRLLPEAVSKVKSRQQRAVGAKAGFLIQGERPGARVCRIAPPEGCVGLHSQGLPEQLAAGDRREQRGGGKQAKGEVLVPHNGGSGRRRKGWQSGADEWEELMHGLAFCRRGMECASGCGGLVTGPSWAHGSTGP